MFPFYISLFHVWGFLNLLLFILFELSISRNMIQEFLFVHLTDSINNDAYLSNIAVVKLNLVLTWVCLYFSWIKFLFKNLRPPFSMITNKRINSKKLVTRKYVKLVSKPLLKSKMCDVFLGIDDHRSWANKSLQIMFFFKRFLNVFSILRQCTVLNVLSTICQICYNSFVPFIR